MNFALYSCLLFVYALTSYGQRELIPEDNDCFQLLFECLDSFMQTPVCAWDIKGNIMLFENLCSMRFFNCWKNASYHVVDPFVMARKKSCLLPAPSYKSGYNGG